MKYSIPDEIRFTRDHVWIRMIDEFIGRCGISSQKAESLGDAVFIDFSEIDIEVRAGEKVATIESHVGIFPLRAPVSGVITAINKILEDDPSRLNKDPYGEGWIFSIDVKEPIEFFETLSEDEYLDYLETEGDI